MIIAILATSIVFFLIKFRQRNPTIFLVCLGTALIGYAFLGKGFAYLDFTNIILLFNLANRSLAVPMFIGEILLIFGLLTLLTSGKAAWFLHLPISKILVLFMLICALQTIPYLETYGIYSIRDAMIWIYAIFAILASILLLHTGRLFLVVDLFYRIFPWYLLWIILVQIGSLMNIIIPNVPTLRGYVDIPIVSIKAGDCAVHLAGISAFMLLGIKKGINNIHEVKEWVLWLLWFICLIIVSSISRSGFISIACSFIIIFALRPSSKWGKILVISIISLFILISFNVNLSMESERTIGHQQIVENIKSIVDLSDRSDLTGTRTWRLNWWHDIVDYTVFGEYFWTGKGFGVNLANDDGYQVLADESLRSPHNGHLTILARSGVPGFIVWCFLQLSFFINFIHAYRHAMVKGEIYWAKIDLWILAYWIAFIVNASFDVFLEGPQAGIWFWCLFGFGAAMLEIQRQKLTS